MGHDFATACLAEGKPRLIRNSPVKAWPAMRRWAPAATNHQADDFAASLGADGPLKVHVSGLPTVRMHSGVQPMGTLPGLEWHRPWTEELMTSDEFMALSRGNKGGDQRKFAYFFSSLDALPASVQVDVGDQSFLTVGWRLVWETNVWVGGPLIRTPTHYDLLHNFYVQVQGHKRFRLYSPEQWPYLYLFPRLHPSTRMSQVDPAVLEQSGVNVSSAFPDYAKMRPHEVVLHPGDVLYLPPYWFHEVTVVGDDVSISVSVHTESDEVALREAVMQHPIPVHTDWPTDIKIKALAHYLHLVTADPLINLDYASGSEAQGPDGGNRFIAALVKTRYAHFGLDPWVDGLAAGVDEAERKWREIERWELGRDDDAEDFALCLDNAELGRHLERHASDLKQKLGRWLSTPHAHIEIGNWGAC